MKEKAKKSQSRGRLRVDNAGSPWRDLWVLGAFLAGILIRASLLTNPGYGPDISYWKSHLTYSVFFGIQNVYGMEMPLQQYPPLLLYILWGLGLIYTGLWPQARDTPLLTAFVKLPAVVADLLVAALLVAFARRHAGTGTLSPRWTAAIIALHPALIWISAYWGQVDILHSSICVAAWGAAIAGSSLLAGGLLALGVMTKPQGLIILPAAAVLLFARTGWRGMLRAFVSGVVVVSALLLPFLLAGYGRELLGIYLGSAGKYPYLSVNAFNPWGVAALFTGGNFGESLVRDDQALGGFLTPRMIGLLLFGVSTVWICLRALLHGGRSSFSASRAWRLLTLQWLAFFLLPTEVHERYLAPALISMIVALILDRRWWWVYLIISLSVLLNVIYVLPGLPVFLTFVRNVTMEGSLVAIALVFVAVVLVRAEIREGTNDAPQ